MAEELNGDWTTDEEIPYRSIRMNPLTLSEIAEVLQDGMQPLFHELSVDVASCPCLSREPYNLAGVGLCGNTSLVEFYHPSTENVPDWNIRRRSIHSIFKASCHDSFIIGSSYATKPYMPYYGHLIINAMYRAPNNITNASRIIFAETGSEQRRIETLTNPNQMTYTFNGRFFVSEGREGNVIRVRAKGRKNSDTDIITSMQTVLENYNRTSFENIFGDRRIGGVLRIKKGRAACNVMWDEYQEPILPFNDLIKQSQCPEINLDSDLIAVGVIKDDKPELLPQEQRYGVNLYRRSEFHCFSNYGAGGQFISDTTPDITEYEGYFNVAEKLCYVF